MSLENGVTPGLTSEYLAACPARLHAEGNFSFPLVSSKENIVILI